MSKKMQKHYKMDEMGDGVWFVITSSTMTMNGHHCVGGVDYDDDDDEENDYVDVVVPAAPVAVGSDSLTL